MRSILMGLAALCLLAMWPAGAAEVKNHPAVKPYAGSIATRRDDDGHRSYSLVVAVDHRGKTDAELFKVLKVDGKVTRLAYENPKNRSAHEIFANYREGLEKGGFEILFACAEGECGPGYASSAWGRVTGLRFHSSAQRYLAAKASKDGQEIYVAVLVAQHRHQVEIVEVGQMTKGLVTASALSEGMTKDGRVVLDGIYFDTDKSTLKPESKPALEAIASYLKENPTVEVFIVGHTDTTGSFEHNMSLSRARAAAVAAALKKQYGIAARRLAAQGVGPLSPRGTNADEAGRGQNRRVEMVQR